MLENLFSLKAHETNLKQETVAGFTTFLGMVYICFVNPSLLSAAGMDHGAVFVATCSAAAIGCILMGLLANYPIALAPGMGLNAYFTYGVVLGMGYTWQVALGAVFLSGIGFLLLSIFRVREVIINSIPDPLKFAISAGIGLFLGIIALKNAGVIEAHPATLITLGDLGTPEALLAIFGFLVMASLQERRIPGGIALTILGLTLLGVLFGLTPYEGIIALPPSIAPTFLQFDIAGALELGFLTVVFAFLFVDLFDTAGTLIGVGVHGNLLDSNNQLPRLKRALLADSTATIAGAGLGTSTTTSYIESALGIEAGGRTGLTAVTTGVLFLAALFFAPLAKTVPLFATAPALLYVACLMARSLSKINWDNSLESIPAVLTAISMPLTFSIATGIGFGFISYAVLRLLTGRIRELNLPVAAIAILFVIKFSMG